MHGGKTCLPDKLVSHYAQRLFDDHYNVRLCVIEMGAKLMLEYDDRYSFHGQLMPLILTGLHDEDEKVSNFFLKNPKNLFFYFFLFTKFRP